MRGANRGGARRRWLWVGIALLLATTTGPVLAHELDEVVPTQPSLPDFVPEMGGIWVDYLWVDFDGNSYTFGPAVLSFDLLTQNRGEAPFDTRPDNPTDLPHSSVSQCTAWTTESVCRRREAVSGVGWDDVNLRHRFGDFALYELRRLDDDDTPDFSEAGLIASRLRGVSCLADDFDVDDADHRAAPRYLLGFCTAAESGVSPGWTDLIAAQTSEQDVSLDGVGDGRYALIISVNHGHHFREATLDNNRLVAIIDIVGKNQPFPEVVVVDKYQG